jgi:CBS domain-containing protein
MTTWPGRLPDEARCATALVVTQAQTLEPVGIIAEADISHLVADGKNPNDVRIYQLMTARPTDVSTTSIRDAARAMTSGRFQHLPVTSGFPPAAARLPSDLRD